MKPAIGVFVVLTLLMMTATIYHLTMVPGQVAPSAYQEINVNIEGFYVESIGHPESYTVDEHYRLVTTDTLEGNPYFTGSTQFLGKTLQAGYNSGSSETPKAYVSIETLHFADKDYKPVSVKEAKPIDSWRWEVLDENGVWHTYVAQVWRQTMDGTATIDPVPMSTLRTNHGWWKPFVIWFKAVPNAPTYFQGYTHPYFAICDVEVVNVERVNPPADKVSTDLQPYLGSPMMPEGTPLCLFAQPFSGTWSDVEPEGWTPTPAELYVDTNGDGQPDAYLSPDVFKNWWYYPFGFTSINSASKEGWWIFGETQGFAESWKFTIGYTILVVGDWVGKRLDDVPLQPYEGLWINIPWWKKLLDFLMSPMGLIFLFLCILLLMYMGSTGVFGATACCMMLSASKRAREVEVDYLDDIRKFRDMKVGKFGRYLYYRIISPPVCMLMDKIDGLADIVWGWTKFVRRWWMWCIG